MHNYFLLLIEIGKVDENCQSTVIRSAKSAGGLRVNGSTTRFSIHTEYGGRLHFGCDELLSSPKRPGGKEWGVQYLCIICSAGP